MVPCEEGGLVGPDPEIVRLELRHRRLETLYFANETRPDIVRVI